MPVKRKANRGVREKLVPQILDRIAGGETLVSIAADLGVHRQRVYEWLADSGETASLAHAREAGADTLAAQATAIIDAVPERYSTEHGSRMDPASVQWQKQRAEQRMKLATVFCPGKYGQRAQIEHSGKDGGPIESVTRVVLVDLVSEDATEPGS